MADPQDHLPVLSAHHLAYLAADFIAKVRSPSVPLRRLVHGLFPGGTDLQVIIDNFPALFPKAWAIIQPLNPAVWLVYSKEEPSPSSCTVLAEHLLAAGLSSEQLTPMLSDEAAEAYLLHELRETEQARQSAADWLTRIKQSEYASLSKFATRILGQDTTVQMSATETADIYESVNPHSKCPPRRFHLPRARLVDGERCLSGDMTLLERLQKVKNSWPELKP